MVAMSNPAELAGPEAYRIDLQDRRQHADRGSASS